MLRDISSSSSSSSSASSEDEGPTPESHTNPDPTESRSTSFQCPADFVSFSYKSCCSTVKAKGSSELWLIKAPASFDPHSFSGLQLPLCGLQTLRVPSGEGAERTYSVLGSSHCSPELRVLTSPKNTPHPASLASPFTGLISICESYGDHSANSALHVIPAIPPPSLPPGLKQRFQHFACRTAPQPAEGGAGRKRRREKRMKTEPEEESVRAELDALTSVKTEVKSEPVDPQYEETDRKRKKKKKSKSDD
ncbi:hypothetical protein NL108_000242 [Boleophthalmus pectinirostris]|uniref:CD3e molecule, epsilon associated protein n=1 Tax=Boleophthalmus pectinirostris TaxID=150288 RepID=UPI000A1C56B9|nr:CD3e molecule, epsilon associated protein [Boleophthalmus pectinirostris]KAJ0063337.1 hypothetical protein NL108_000242 [Boleophthalmus pectinirostris]